MTTATAAQTFAIDKTHSEATFQVRHLITKVRGRFADFGGTINFHADQPAQSSVNFTIQAASIDTSTPDRDAHLRSDDFFAVEKYPTITFDSTGITAVGGNDYHVTGNLTMRGVTKAITIPVTLLGTAVDPWGNQKIAFEGEVTINRKDYGLNWNAALEAGGFLVGDDVKISLSIQAAAVK
jgi:polyisoprenoid-binding protein YceI